ncbi:SPFH domain-containing protein [uncultured Chloroflexus sp.]|uniref:SPFH domain-containing protein n=1 Tax=uncultured Chloroflexus sp. TaxID=214040 RepID=UPI002634F363|nr:SPFH domain-containing protein [uncultured Chloroflexus sp.]
MNFLISTIPDIAIAFGIVYILIPIIFVIFRFLGIYTVVQEGTCHVYTLFGSVVGVLREPGLVILPFHLGINAFLIGLFGRRYVIDMRLDQRYLRSLPVNSEEGAPMGIGVWYEMSISDPVAFLFKNADPQGSLAANVSNAVVRTLSNMPLAQMLENRHAMSQAVRAEVSPKAAEWGYRLGSVYIRKVHFRDINMIRQIEAKVVNRLRQVTSAILQDGANRVDIITSTAERQAAIEFARAKAVRPQILGRALAKISTDPEVRDALFTILELQNLAESKARVILMPAQTDNRIIPALMAAQDGR